MGSTLFRFSGRSLVLAATLAMACAANAGTVFLKDGSVVHGDLGRLDDGSLTVDTAFAGKLTIDAVDIKGVVSDEPMVVTFANGDEVQGRLARGAQGQQKLVGTEFGAIPVALGQVRGVRPEGTPSPLELKLTALRNDRWSGRLLFGLSGSSGNDESRDLSIGAEAKRKSLKSRLYLDLYVDRGREDGELTAAQVIGTVRLERDFSKRFFAFLQTQMERDEFANVDFRSTTTIGPGYYFILENHEKLKGRLGVGYEYIQPETDEGRVSDIVLTLGYDYMAELGHGFKLTHEFTIIPRLSQDPLDNYRIESTVGLNMALGDDTGWSLQAQYRLEYDSNPEPDVVALDTSYLLNLVREFE